MRKRIIESLFFVFVLLACTSCASVTDEYTAASGSSPEAENETETLRICHHIEAMNQGKPYDVGVGKLLRRFTEETGIQVELISVAWDQIDRQLIVDNRGGQINADLYNVSSQRLAGLVSNRALMPLDGYLGASELKDAFSANVLNMGTYPGDGKLYLIPQSLHTRGLWYNKDYVSEPPKTLEEMISLAQRINRLEEDVYGLAIWGGLHYGSAEGLIAPLTWAAGGKLCDESGRAAWNNEAVAFAIRFMSDCVNKYKVTPVSCIQTKDYTDIQEMFSIGKFAMILDGSYSYSVHSFDEANSERFGFAPMPGIDGPAKNFSNGWAWGIPAKSERPDLAWRFIEWFEQESIQAEHAILEGSLPTRASAYNDLGEKIPLFNEFVNNFDRYGRAMDPFVYYQEAMEELSLIATTYCLEPDGDLEKMLQDSAELYNKKYYN